VSNKSPYHMASGIMSSYVLQAFERSCKEGAHNQCRPSMLDPVPMRKWNYIIPIKCYICIPSYTSTTNCAG